MTIERRESAMENLLYRPKDAAQALGIGRATLYDLMRSGRLRSVKDGGKRFITLDALRDYIRQLEVDADEVA
jgi:excisionase family DNA binding protein